MPIKDKAKAKAKDAAWYRRNRKAKIAYQIKRLHGANGWRGIRAAKLEEQDYRCAACGADSPQTKNGWQLDHNHHTGKIRGVLCAPCNVALGFVKDDVDRLVNLALYLERHK